MNLEERILINLAVLTRDYTRTWHAVDHTLRCERYEASARRAYAANDRETLHAGGWFASPRLGSDMQRSRAVKKLLADDFIEEMGRGRGRVIRLTDAGREAAEALMGGGIDNV